MKRHSNRTHRVDPASACEPSADPISVGAIRDTSADEPQELTFNLQDLTTLSEVFGTTDPILAEGITRDLLNVLAPTDVEFVLAFLRAKRPKNVCQALRTTVLTLTYKIAMEAGRKAQHPEQTPAGRTAYLNEMRKLLVLHIQIDAMLTRDRGDFEG